MNTFTEETLPTPDAIPFAPSKLMRKTSNGTIWLIAPTATGYAAVLYSDPVGISFSYEALTQLQLDNGYEDVYGVGEIVQPSGL